ncbi:unnamed protein product, partial [Cladocopium goreaui]
ACPTLFVLPSSAILRPRDLDMPKCILLVLRLLLVCWVAVDSSFLLSFIFSSNLPSLKPTLVGLLVVPPGLSLALSALWATFWVSTRRVRYSSPWLRALFLGGSLHLDVAWVTRLAAAASWSNHGGTCSGALRSWFRSHDFTSVRPWVWRHPVASVEVDLSVRPGPKMLAWCFVKTSYVWWHRASVAFALRCPMFGLVELLAAQQPDGKGKQDKEKSDQLVPPTVPDPPSPDDPEALTPERAAKEDARPVNRSQFPLLKDQSFWLAAVGILIRTRILKPQFRIFADQTLQRVLANEKEMLVRAAVFGTQRNPLLWPAHVGASLLRKSVVADTIETSPLLPESQRAWSCPLCNHGLPELPTQARVLDSTKWLIGGDFNETPNDSQFAELVRSLNDFWVHFWQDHARSVPDLASRTSSLLAGARVPETPVNIRCPTGIELQARAQSGSGAAGPDGWLLLVCWVAVDSSFPLSFVFSNSLPSPKLTMVGLLVVPPGLSLALSGLPFGSQLAVSGTPVRGCVLFSWEVACTWMSPGSLAWWLRSFVLAFGLVILPGLIMVGLVPALCVPGSVLTISRPSVLGSGAIPSPLSKSTFLFVPVPKCWSLLSVLLNTMFGKAGGLGFGKNILNVAGMRSSPFLSLIKLFLLCFFGYQEHSFVDLVQSRRCHGRIGCHVQSGNLLSHSFVVSFFCLPVGVRGHWILGAHRLGVSVLKVRCWLAKCQDSIWNTKEP